jgi:hypothetical protein
VNRHSISICFLRKGTEAIKKGETNNRESRERRPIGSSKLKHEKYEGQAERYFPKGAAVAASLEAAPRARLGPSLVSLYEYCLFS